jgi:hypothetical protein
LPVRALDRVDSEIDRDRLAGVDPKGL